MAVDIRGIPTALSGSVGGIHSVPEPSSIALATAGFLGLIAYRRRARPAGRTASKFSTENAPRLQAVGSL